MTRREARRVACLIAATQVSGYLDAGSIMGMDAHVGDHAVSLVEEELTTLADRLDERGRREDGAVVSLGDALRVAGVSARPPVPEGE